MHSLRSASVLLLSCLALVPLQATAWERGTVETFATLPSGFGYPEGITVDRQGNLYVATFAVNAGGRPGQMFVYDPQGHLIRQVSVAGASNLLLGLAFHPQSGALLVLDFGNPRVLQVDPVTGAASVFATIPTLVGGPGPNALTFDHDGNVYVSDSFQGIIWRIAPGGGLATVWLNDPLLRTSGVPPFGANGLEFNRNESALFVANTGDDRIIRIPVINGAAGSAEVFVNSVNGADGLIIDEHDNLWVAANQADEIVVIDPTGKVIAKLGDFDGIDRRGTPRGLLFPASPVRFGGWLYVTNLALDLRLFGLAQAVDSQWTAQVKTFTISRIRARIPR